MTQRNAARDGGFAQNAPAMGRSFEAANAPSREQYVSERVKQANEQAQARSNHRIATRAELDQRLAQRATPAPALELNMHGSIGQSSRRSANAENEREIYKLQRQLEAKRNEPTRQFERNR